MSLTYPDLPTFLPWEGYFTEIWRKNVDRPTFGCFPHYIYRENSTPDYDEAGTKLHKAVKNDDLETIKKLISEGTSVNSRTIYYYETPVHWAARLGKLEALKLLASLGASLTARDRTRQGKAPIHGAILYGHDAIVEWLLDHKVPVNSVSEEGATSLCYAIRERNINIVTMLINRGVNVNQKCPRLGSVASLHAAVIMRSSMSVSLLLNNGADKLAFCDSNLTPIHYAAIVGNVEIFRLLAKSMFEMSVQTNDDLGYQPIHLAVIRGNIEVIEYLLNNGISLDERDKRGHAPMHTAANHGEIDVVKFLIMKGADVNIRTQNTARNTPLHLAAFRGFCRIISLLHKSGADMYAEDETEKHNVMHYAVKGNHMSCLVLLNKLGCNRFINLNSVEKENLLVTAARYDCHEAACWLADKGFPINTKGAAGLRALHHAAYLDSMAVVLLLLDRGVDVHVKDNQGRTPMHCAAYAGHAAMIGSLMSNSGNVFDTDNDGLTALHYAAMGGNLGSVRVILLKDKEGKLCNAKTKKNGDHAVHLAASRGHIEVTDWFINKGISVDLPNNKGLTPLTLAALGGHCDLVENLLLKGANIQPTENNAENVTPLHAAACSGVVKIARLLLERGADVNACTVTRNEKPYHWAVLKGHNEMMELLSGQTEE
ncbi:putative ankyrin repeat protein RF_0381 [Periplaneta americana]|uniref:putative ankyrin repeat protein RF_0381 n=1 Tax=Periplaneta americana TaxID=6978 RepID=UPI0037E96EC9